jgi:DNA-binding transcriptional MerR regulator
LDTPEKDMSRTREADLLTAGEFAALARTTKRTVLWYGAQGILMPWMINESGHRFYRPQQIVDFQVIMLMRGQGVSLAEIARHLAGGQPLQQLFADSQESLAQKITQMQNLLDATNRYYGNLAATGTLVKPHMKSVGQYAIYCLEKHGPYAKINDYHDELRNEFTSIPPGTVFLTVLLDTYYSPRAANMKIAVVCQDGMKLKPDAKLQIETMPAYTALSYSHTGSGALLSLITQQMVAYRAKNGFSRDERLPFFSVELYDPATPPDLVRGEALRTELQLPLTMT